jgi:predicted NAD/FAD-binding protein
MIRDILRFNREAPRLLTTNNLTQTLEDYLEEYSYSAEFIEHYLVPMGAAIWSSEPEKLLEFPAQFLIRFFHHHGMLSIDDRPQWRVVQGGSVAYVQKLVQGFRDRIRLNTPVTRVHRSLTHVEIETAGGARERFDRVIFACHSDQALALLADPTPTEREVLGAIPYQENDVVLHTDTRLLPTHRAAWAAWNYHVPLAPKARVAVTYNMNILQSIVAPATFCVTLNYTEAIAPEKIIARLRYRHPIFDVESVAAQARHAELNGRQHSWFCGAYWRNGFHEDGVASTLAMLKQFGEQLKRA